jgi:hypothetical protein
MLRYYRRVLKSSIREEKNGTNLVGRKRKEDDRKTR